MTCFTKIVYKPNKLRKLTLLTQYRLLMSNFWYFCLPDVGLLCAVVPPPPGVESADMLRCTHHQENTSFWPATANSSAPHCIVYYTHCCGTDYRYRRYGDVFARNRTVLHGLQPPTSTELLLNFHSTSNRAQPSRYWRVTFLHEGRDFSGFTSHDYIFTRFCAIFYVKLFNTNRNNGIK